MTSFIAWAGIDNRAISSVYFASDSRLSGPLKYNSVTGRTIESWHWDYGRKLFASRNYPDIFGYVGDVLFPSQILGEMVDLIDSGILFGPDDQPDIKLEKIIGYLNEASNGYPFMKGVKIFYCSRLDFNNRTGIKSTFRIFSLTSVDNKWDINRWGIPNRSREILIDGSGKSNIEAALKKWRESSFKETSRSIYSAFCDGLESTTDPNSGGSPQLVGIHRKGMGKYFGVIYKEQRYFLGLPINRPLNPDKIEWFNDLFEIANGKTKKRQANAQKHQDIQ